MPDLPDVEQKFIANTTDYVTNIQLAINRTKDFRDMVASTITEIRAMADALGDLSGSLEISTNIGSVTSELEALQSVINGLHGKQVDIGINEITRDLAQHVTTTKSVIDTISDHVDVTQDLSESQGRGAASLDALGISARKAQADVAALGGSEKVLAAAEATSTAATLKAAMADAQRAFAANDSEIALARLYGTVAAGTGVIRDSADVDDIAANNGVKLAIAYRNLVALGPDIQASLDGVNKGVADSAMWAGRAYAPWWLLGNAWKTALHWIVAGTAEFLAVAVPAAIAGALGAFVLYQGVVENVGRHLQALYTTTEAMGPAFGKTAGDVLGLGHAFQTAQDQANPIAYELLGSALNAARQHMVDFAGAGLQVADNLARFSAEVNVALKGSMGGEIQGLLSSMVRDLQGLGATAANLGRALLNLASDMPGLVQFLLDGVQGISKFLVVLTNAPGHIIMFAIALEEMYRWGGLLIGVLARVTGGLGTMNAIAGSGGFITRFGAGIIALVGQGGVFLTWLGKTISGVGEAGNVFSRVGGSISAFGQDMTEATYTLTPGFVAGAAAAVFAIAAIIVALSHAKNATQSWIDETNKAVKNAQDMQVLSVVATAMAQLTQRMQQQEGLLHSYGGAAQAVGQGFATWIGWVNKLPGPLGNAAQGVFNLATGTGYWSTVLHTVLSVVPGLNTLLGSQAGKAEEAASSIDRLKVEQSALIGTVRTFGSNLEFLGQKFGITAVGALTLASAAGVNLTQGLLKGTEAGKVAQQQIDNLRRGLGAMTAPAGVIGADMEALGVQSQLAGTKISQVNGAFDQFIGTLTSGMQGLSQFEGALHGMGHDTAATSQSITGAINNISRSAASMGYTLQGFGPKAQQSWQQFSSAVQQGNTILDTMRTGMAEGVVSGTTYMNSIKDVVGQLLPFAAHSRAATSEISAIAQEAGGPATTNLKTLADWAGITGNKARDQLYKGFERATIGMSNLSQVAQNLSAVISSQLDQSMAKAIVGASGLSGAFTKYFGDLRSGHATHATLAQDLKDITGDESFVNQMTQKGTDLQNQLNNSFAVGAAKAAILHGKYQDLGNIVNATSSGRQRLLQDMASMISKSPQAAGDIQNLAKAIANQGQQSSAARGARQQLINDLEAVGVKSSTAKGLVHLLISMLGNIPHQELVNLILHGTASGHVSITESIFGRNTSSTPKLAQAKKKAAGGHITGSGTGTSDSIPAYLSAGEYVVNAKAVNRYGTHMLDHINAQRFAEGGSPTIQGYSPSGIGKYAQNFNSNFKSRMTSEFRNELQSELNAGLREGLSSAMAAARASLAGAFGGGGGGGGGSGGPASLAGLERLWEAAGGSSNVARLMAAIAMAESGGNANAYNPSGASGLWQILGAVSPGNLFNPAVNARNAVIKYETQGLGAWVTYTSGAYQQYYDKGGMLKPGVTTAINNTGKPEFVIPGEHMMRLGGGHEHHIHNHIYLDGKEIWKNQQPYTLQYNTRNTGARTGAVIPGTRPQT